MRLRSPSARMACLMNVRPESATAALFVERLRPLRRIEQIRESRWVDDYGTLPACRKRIEQVRHCSGHEIAEPRSAMTLTEKDKFVSYLAKLASSAAIEPAEMSGL